MEQSTHCRLNLLSLSNTVSWLNTHSLRSMVSMWLLKWPEESYITVVMTETERDRERQRETERDRETQRDTERHRETQRRAGQ